MSTTATLNPGDRMCRGRNGWFKPARIWACWMGAEWTDWIPPEERYLDISISSKREGNTAPIILRLNLGDALKLLETISKELESVTKEVS